MAFKAIVFCVIAVLGQVLAGSSYRKSIPTASCACGSNRVSISVNEEISTPAYSSEGIALSEVNYQSNYKPVSGSASPVLVSENGGALLVTSIGPIAPAGIAIATDLGLAGDLVLSGEVPYLSAVAFEGQFDSSGSAAVSYGCGDGCIAITEQIGNAAPSAYSASLSGGFGKY